jgi:DNA polymerase-4
VVIGGGRDAQPRLLADGTRSFSSLRHYVGRGVVTTKHLRGAKASVVFLGPGGIDEAAVLCAPTGRAAAAVDVQTNTARNSPRRTKAAVQRHRRLFRRGSRHSDESYIDAERTLPGVPRGPWPQGNRHGLERPAVRGAPPPA